MSRSQRTLEHRLAEGVVIGAEGYVFELERRGYIKAGPYVPEVILDGYRILRHGFLDRLRLRSAETIENCATSVKQARFDLAACFIRVLVAHTAHRGTCATAGQGPHVSR